MFEDKTGEGKKYKEDSIPLKTKKARGIWRETVCGFRVIGIE